MVCLFLGGFRWFKMLLGGLKWFLWFLVVPSYLYLAGEKVQHMLNLISFDIKRLSHHL